MAVDGKADLLVTGDKILMALQSFRDIPIVTARDAFQRSGLEPQERRGGGECPTAGNDLWPSGGEPSRPPFLSRFRLPRHAAEDAPTGHLGHPGGFRKKGPGGSLQIRPF
ncbi:MAG: hypothetical protein ACYDDF_14725 [Thermoplasmatota archaeon]